MEPFIMAVLSMLKMIMRKCLGGWVPLLHETRIRITQQVSTNHLLIQNFQESCILNSAKQALSKESKLAKG